MGFFWDAKESSLVNIVHNKRVVMKIQLIIEHFMVHVKLSHSFLIEKALAHVTLKSSVFSMPIPGAGS